MSDKDLQRYRHYEKLVRESQKAKDPEKKPPSCAKCRYYQPEFRYRKCLYARCPYQRETDIFRKRPMKRDKIPNPGTGKRDKVPDPGTGKRDKIHGPGTVKRDG